jgi:hypothetical protein
MNKPNRPVGRRHGALRLRCNIRRIGVMRWPAMIALVTLLVAVALPVRAARIDAAPFDALPIIGVTPSKSTGVNLSSRGRRAPAGEAAVGAADGGAFDGDAYDAVGLYLDETLPASNAWDLDSLPDTHTFGLPFDEDAGINFFSLVPMRIHGEDRGAGAIPDQQGTNLFTVSYFTVDQTPLLPIGAVFSPLGTMISGWGFDVGFFDPIDIGLGVTFVVHDSGIQFIDNTIADPLQRVVADFSIDDTSTPPNGGLSGRGGARVQGRAAGIPIDEMVMYWDVTVSQIVPEPSTSLLLVLGVACFAVGRCNRRRRCT